MPMPQLKSAAMADEVEQMAEAIHRENPVRLNGVPLDLQEVVRTRPDRATEFREAARNRIRAAEAMKRLNEVPGGTP